MNLFTQKLSEITKISQKAQWAKTVSRDSLRIHAQWKRQHKKVHFVVINGDSASLLNIYCDELLTDAYFHVFFYFVKTMFHPTCDTGC